MKRTRMIVLFLAMIVSLAMSQSNVDPAHKFAWTENVGWTNWRDSGDDNLGVNAGASFLSGFVWGENIGFIDLGDGTPVSGLGYANLDGTDFGVNIAFDGSLHGLAWGENVGWINFDTASPDREGARFDACTHQFFGYAWGENIGWVSLGDVTHFLALGPCPFADGDCDQDVDLEDARMFLGLIGGPGAPADCPAFDRDEDGDVDLLDVAEFLVAFEAD